MSLSHAHMEKCAAAIMLVLLGCATTIQVRDVLELPPPQNVRGVRENGRVTVTWEASAVKPKEFSGYLLYYSERSLAYVPFATMPSAVELPALATEYSFTFSDSLPVFIQLRSRSGRDHVSLPSLPEVALPPAQ